MCKYMLLQQFVSLPTGCRYVFPKSLNDNERHSEIVTKFRKKKKKE